MTTKLPYSSRGLGTIRGARRKTIQAVYSLATQNMPNNNATLELFTQKFLEFSNLPKDLFTKKMGDYPEWSRKSIQERKDFTNDYIIPVANELLFMEKLTDFVIALVDDYNDVNDDDVDPSNIISQASTRRFGKDRSVKLSETSKSRIRESKTRQLEKSKIRQEQRQLRNNSGFYRVPLSYLQSGGDKELYDKLKPNLDYLINLYGTNHVYAAWQDRINVNDITSKRYKKINITTSNKAIATIIHFLRAMFQRYASRLDRIFFYFYRSEHFKDIHRKYPNLFVSIDSSNCIINPINDYLSTKIEKSKTDKKKNLFKKIKEKLDKFVEENKIVENGLNVGRHADSISSIIKSSLRFKDIFNNTIYEINKPKSKVFTFSCTSNQKAHGEILAEDIEEADWTFSPIQEVIYAKENTLEEVFKYVTPTSIIQILGNDSYKVFDRNKTIAIKPHNLKLYQEINNITIDDNIFSLDQLHRNKFFSANKRFINIKRDSNEQELFKLADSHRLTIDYNKGRDTCFLDQNSAYPTAVLTIEGKFNHPNITPYGYPNYPTHYYYFLKELDPFFLPMNLLKMTGFFLVRIIKLDQILSRQLQPYFFKQDNKYNHPDDIFAVLPSSLLSYIISKPNNQLLISAIFWNNQKSEFSLSDFFIDDKFYNNSLIGSLIFNEDKMSRKILISIDSYEYFRDILMSNNRFLGPHEPSSIIEYKPTSKEIESARGKKNYHIHSYILAAQNILFCDILYKAEEANLLHNVTKTKLDAIYFDKNLPLSFLKSLNIGKGHNTIKYIKTEYGKQRYVITSSLPNIELSTDKIVELKILSKIPAWADNSTNIYYMDKGINVYMNNECAGSGKSHRSFSLSKYSSIFMTQTNNLVQDAKDKVHSITTYKAFDISPFIETKVSMKLPREHIHIFDEVGLLKTDIARETILSSIRNNKLVFCSYDEYQTNFDSEIYAFLSKINNSLDVQTGEQHRMSRSLQSLAEEIKSLGRWEAIDKIMSVIVPEGRGIRLDDFTSLSSKIYDRANDIILCGTNASRSLINTLLEVGYSKDIIKTRDLVSRQLRNDSLARGKIRIWTAEEFSSYNGKKNIEIADAFTVHSVQGQTIKGNVFINILDMWETNIIYTAITRAKSLENIYIIY